jgi:AraC-like DNA-binding protein
MKLKDVATMEKIQEYIEKYLAEDIPVEKLCRDFEISRNKLQNLFKDLLGDTVNEYIIKQRMYYVADKLINTDDSIRKIAEDIGGNRVNFYKQFKRIFHCLPGEYRQQTRVPPTLSFVPRSRPTTIQQQKSTN